MAKRCSKRRSLRNHRRTRRRGMGQFGDRGATGGSNHFSDDAMSGGRKKMVRTRGRGRTRRGGLAGNIGAATADVKVLYPTHI